MSYTYEDFLAEIPEHGFVPAVKNALDTLLPHAEPDPELPEVDDDLDPDPEPDPEPDEGPGDSEDSDEGEDGLLP